MSDLDEFGYSKDFKKCRLGDISHIEMGQSPDSRFVFGNPFLGYPFLQGNAEFGVVSPSAKFGCIQPAKLVKENDVLISVRAPAGDVNIADKNYCIGRGLAGIRIGDIAPTLSAKLIQHQSAKLRRVAQGTTFEAISKSDLQTLILRIPPSAELPVIAKVLDTLDTTIHQTEAIIEKLKQVKQGLLHDLLTRGVDANGELRPRYEQAPELYQASPLGWIPKEWSVKPLSDSINLISGQHISTDLCNSVGKGVPYFTGPSDFFGTTTIVTSYTSHPQIMCNEGDLLITVKGSGCGKIALAGIRACISRQLMAIRVDENTLLYWFAIFQNLQPQFNRMATGGNIPGIGRNQILDFLLSTPNRIEEMELIGLRIEAMDARCAIEGQKLAKLKLNKSALMDDLLTGRVRVTPLLVP